MTRREFAGLVATGAICGSPPSQTTFDFQSGFWIKLHFVLYNLASGRKEGRLPDVSALSAAEAAAWNGALDYYEANVIAHAFGEFPMILIAGELASQEGAQRLKKPETPDPVYPVLESAAPVYRAHWWAEHDRKNREWIDVIAPLIATHEDALRPALARAYDTKWPQKPIRAEASYYLTRSAGYTSLNPTLVTVSSWSTRNAGVAGIETVFHEAGHSLVQRMQDEIDAAASRLGRKPAHADLWHALMFYTTGELVRRRLPTVEPYAIKYGMWEHDWPGLFEILERRWKPFLDGQGSFREAIGTIVAEEAK